MEELIGIIAAGASGGIFGVLASVVGAGMKLWNHKQDLEAKKQEWAHEERLIELEMKRDHRKAEYELEIVREAGANQLLVTGIESQGNLEGTSQWVKNIIALVRPFMTVFLWVIAYRMFLDLKAMTIYDPMLVKLTAISFFSASSTTTFWFSDRSITKRIHELF